MSFKIVIVGAGLGGLAAAVSIKTESPKHDVLVLESAPSLAEVCFKRNNENKLLIARLDWCGTPAHTQCDQAS